MGGLLLYPADEPVAPAADRLHETRIFCRIVESSTHAVHCRIEPAIKIHEGIIGPKSFSQLVARH
jgi:hypothetical protein